MNYSRGRFLLAGLLLLVSVAGCDQSAPTNLPTAPQMPLGGGGGTLGGYTLANYTPAGMSQLLSPAPVPVIVNLGAAGTHGILAGSTLTCVALGTVNADVSVWPGSAMTGFPPCVINGATHAADTFAQTAQSALTVAYNQLDAMACGATITSDLGGQTLQPGVYCSASTVGLTGEMFLDGLGDSNAIFVIKAGSALTTAAARVTLLNGAQASNVYWLVGSSATLGVGSEMKGNIIAFTSITIVDNSTIVGRALARNGAVTLGTSNTITLPLGTTQITQIIGVDGGTIEFSGHTIVVPAGAVAQPTLFEVNLGTSGYVEVQFKATLTDELGGVFNIGEQGFEHPIRVTLSYAHSTNVPDASTLLVLRAQGPDGQPEPLPSTVDLVNEKVTADLEHFSLYYIAFPN